MREITFSVGPLAAASANAICLSQTPGAAGNLTIAGALASGGVATMDTPRRVLITAAGNESTKTFTIYGTNWSGQNISETITGPNVSTAQSVLDYATVTRISISAAAAGAITVGTSGVASSQWVMLDHWANAQTAVQAVVSGTANYTIQQTLDSTNSTTAPVAPTSVTWFSSADAAVVNATASAQSSYAYSPTMVRVTLNSGSGSVTVKLVQFGVVPY